MSDVCWEKARTEEPATREWSRTRSAGTGAGRTSDVASARL